MLPTQKQDHFTKHIQAVKSKQLRYWEHRYLCQKSSVSYSNRKAIIKKHFATRNQIKLSRKAKEKVISGTEILKQEKKKKKKLPMLTTACNMSSQVDP